MKLGYFAAALVLGCLASRAEAAGIQLFNDGPALSGAIWYPCAGKPEDVALGDLAVGADFGLMGAKDCPVTGAKLPLVILSHGRDGWFGANHDTAEALADAGFVVAAINHPGDTYSDNSRRNSLSVLASRPVDMIRLLNFMLHDWKDRAAIDPARIGLFGFSNGGYTGLVLMGVTPDFRRVAELCQEKTGECGQLHNGEAAPNPPHDARIKAAVIGCHAVEQAAKLYSSLEATGDTCPTIQDVVNSKKLDAKNIADPWGTNYKIECVEGEIHGISAGNDHKCQSGACSGFPNYKCK